MTASKSSRGSGSSPTGGSTPPAADQPAADQPAPERERPAGSQTSSSEAVEPSGNAAEQLLRRIARQLDVVMLTRDRIQETLDEAAEGGRVTRHDANMLVTELVRRGRQQTEDLMRELEQLLDRGRGGLESATRLARRAEPVDRIVRGADRARRSVAGGSSFPISDYDELTARQVQERLGDLRPPDLRKVREYERRHANRKTVLEAIERALA